MDPNFKEGKKLPTVPEEINEDILTRLPIKSLVRFLSVSRSWLSLILDPKFVKSQLTHSIKQNRDYHDNLVVLKSNGVGIISRYKETCYLLPFLVHHMVGSINGLICVYRLGRFWLWNPVIYKFKEFMPAENKNLYRETRKESCYTHLLGFGWDHLSNDFKLISCYLSERLRKCVVYSSNSDSWAELLIPDSIFPQYLFKNMGTELTPATIVNNCPYWKFSNNKPVTRRERTTLIKFEVETNEFRLLPEFDYGDGDRVSFDLVNINDCLAALVYTALIYRAESAIDSVDVYTLNEGSGVWSKMYTLGSINLDVRNFTQGFKYGGEIVFNNMGTLSCYDPKTGVVNGLLDSSSFHVEKCFTYTPTLVFLHGMKTVEYFNGTHKLVVA